MEKGCKENRMLRMVRRKAVEKQVQFCDMVVNLTPPDGAGFLPEASANENRD